ncbi:MAG: hypothetical protein ACE5G2_01935 [Candidatus Krumholzibacteriia bacterium]
MRVTSTPLTQVPSGQLRLCPRALQMALGAGLVLLVTGPGTPWAGPALDLSERILIDGFSDEFEPDEELFGINDEFVKDGIPCQVGGDPDCPPEESVSDSQWGFFNDVNQIKVTWDARFLYVAVDGITWDNNMMLYFDITRVNGGASDRGTGIPSLLNVNAWRRNISFANGFEPDFFLATWDRNETPQIWRYQNPRNVNQVPTSLFSTAATFSQNAEGRAMEAAIPWSLVLQSDSTLVSAAYGDTVPIIPAGFDTLRLIACVTAGPDGTGSPDGAPDNFSGFQVDGFAPATLDNFVILPLDILDANGAEVPDGVPDMRGAGQTFDISIAERVTFLERPPILGVAFSLDDVEITQGVVSPEEGHELRFSVQIEPKLDDAAGRSVTVTAEIYDLRGQRIQVLYENERVSVLEAEDFRGNRWDGRDQLGRMVAGGMYVLRVGLEPGQNQAQRSFAVIR